MTLTIDQIKDLAEFAGLVVIGDVTDDDKETEITINPCPKKGIQDGDGSIIHCRHIAYMEEYPEEGVAPLGPTNGHGREPVPELCMLPVHVDLDWLNTGGSHGLSCGEYLRSCSTNPLWSPSPPPNAHDNHQTKS